MDNLEKSERVVAAILKKLLEQGLQWSEIEFAHLGLDDEYRPFFTTSARWLVDEGLIRGDIGALLHGAEWIAQPVLTAKGFQILGASLDGGGADVTAGERSKQIAEAPSGGWKIGELLGGLVGGFTKSIGNG